MIIGPIQVGWIRSALYSKWRLKKSFGHQNYQLSKILRQLGAFCKLTIGFADLKVSDPFDWVQIRLVLDNFCQECVSSQIYIKTFSCKIWQNCIIPISHYGTRLVVLLPELYFQKIQSLTIYLLLVNTLLWTSTTRCQ